jgi:homocitrate synthase
MVPIDLSNGNGSHASSVVSNGASNGSNGHTNGANGHSNGVHKYQEQQRRNPYAPRASDFLNNVSNFSIIESTLRGK